MIELNKLSPSELDTYFNEHTTLIFKYLADHISDEMNITRSERLTAHFILLTGIIIKSLELSSYVLEKDIQYCYKKFMFQLTQAIELHFETFKKQVIQ